MIKLNLEGRKYRLQNKIHELHNIIDGGEFFGYDESLISKSKKELIVVRGQFDDVCKKINKLN